MRPDSPRVFDEWPSNAYITASVSEGNPETLASAPIRLRRRLRLNRQATVSLEGRGSLAYWDHRLNELVVYLSTQGGQVKRMALSRMLGIPEERVRVIAPDVGGGFGGKNLIMPEDVAVAAIAMKVKHPVRWIEDRREHLLASVHCRDHTYDLTISADRDGTLLGLEGDIYIDKGVISLIGRGLTIPAEKVVDASGMLVMPGGVDVHTHLDMPFGGTTSTDDFETGTIAAAHGGTTTLIDFAIQDFGSGLYPAFEGWMKRAEGKAVIDYGFHMIVRELNEQAGIDMDRMARHEGITSFLEKRPPRFSGRPSQDMPPFYPWWA